MKEQKNCGLRFFYDLQQQLQLLMETLSSSEPHYIRCVKPNSDNKPGKFENQSVLHQLKCAVSAFLFKRLFAYINS